jgi:hypothetical protein
MKTGDIVRMEPSLARTLKLREDTQFEVFEVKDKMVTLRYPEGKCRYTIAAQDIIKP